MSEHYMQRALTLAELGRGNVGTNPMVGCVIVKNNRIIAEAYHERFGGLHAEALALSKLNGKAKNATLYVNLEPCCHYGKTPPCTQAIIAAGIKHVVIATIDPHAIVAGKGVAELEAAGISVEIGLLAEKAQQLNEIYFHYIQHRTPFVIAKWAMSLDGKTITHPEDSQKISNALSHAHTHRTRSLMDAILIGSQTAILDNPQLTAREADGDYEKQPLRIILSSKGDLPPDLALFHTAKQYKTLIVTTDAAPADWINLIEKTGAIVFIAPHDAAGQVDLIYLLKFLGEQRITSLLVEGGQTLLTSFFANDLVNRVDLYLAPNIIGPFSKKKYLSQVKLTQLSDNFYISARL